LIVLSLLGLILVLKNKQLKKTVNFSFLIIFLWWILPLIADAGIAKVFTSRYILYTLPPLIIILSLGLFNLLKFLKNHSCIYVSYLVLILVLVLNINFIYQLSTAPFKIKLPSTETGYLTDWTSGWGIKESAVYLKSRSLEKNIIVGTEGYFGTLPDGLQIYTQNTKQLTVFGVGVGFTQIPEKLIIAQKAGDEVYILVNQSRNKLSSADTQKLSIVRSYDKPNNDKLILYKL
jgi:hypothetical protein